MYQELRKLAAAKLASEQPGQTLEATGLVHEAWLKLADASVDWNDKTHFIRAAATAMRQILVDRARAKLAAKRGGENYRIELQDLASPLPDAELMSLDEALTAPKVTKSENLKFSVLDANEIRCSIKCIRWHVRKHTSHNLPSGWQWRDKLGDGRSTCRVRRRVRVFHVDPQYRIELDTVIGGDSGILSQDRADKPNRGAGLRIVQLCGNSEANLRSRII